jgi:hypothetical protein
MRKRNIVVLCRNGRFHENPFDRLGKRLLHECDLCVLLDDLVIDGVGRSDQRNQDERLGGFPAQAPDGVANLRRCRVLDIASAETITAANNMVASEEVGTPLLTWRQGLAGANSGI